MARARSIETGDETAGVRVEYIKTRRMVRLGGWHSKDRDIRSVEVPASRFLEDLGIAPEELGAIPTYLVLALVQDSRTRAARHFAAAFPSELEARHVFLRLRAEHQQPDEWAQVVALDARCRMTALCWFGTPGELNAGRLESASSGEDAPAGRSRRWASRRQRA
jgi:hypothetical protein